ncbi:T9SS type A sorting domain-containing protein [Ferruginibacter sp.]
MKITDASGRLVETKQTATNSAIQVGNKLPAGIYFAEVMQDGKVQRMKLVKQ